MGIQNINTDAKSFSDKELRELIYLGKETKNLDYKASLNWKTASNEHKCELIKDILAFANTQDGGIIIIGVEDNCYTPLGVGQEIASSFDVADLNQFLNKYTDPKFSCQVYSRDIEGLVFVIVEIPEFSSEPIICKKNGHFGDKGQNKVLTEGTIYIRTESAQSIAIPSAKEMRELLGRAVAKKGDELLGSIERLIKGKPLKTSADDKNLFEVEIKEAESFFKKNIGNYIENFGYWEFIIHPTSYNSNLINLGGMKELVRQAQVGLRGQSFPYSHESASFSNNGLCSFDVFPDYYIEAFCLNQSGLFTYKKILWEDLLAYNEKDVIENGLGFISVIYLITEALIFAERFYKLIKLEADLNITVNLVKAKDRKLFSEKPLVSLHNDYISKIDKISVAKNIMTVEPSSSYLELARNIAKEIFWRFNWDNVADEVTEGWQNSLLNRTF